jgi:hypothetical protein
MRLIDQQDVNSSSRFIDYITLRRSFIEPIAAHRSS